MRISTVRLGTALSPGESQRGHSASGCMGVSSYGSARPEARNGHQGSSGLIPACFGAARVLVTAVLVLFSTALAADVFVWKVSDGDTIWVKDESGKRTKVRLNRIDAPEMNQPFGKESADYLAKLILGSNVVVKSVGKDRYGRSLDIVHLGESDINLKMVQDGYAWHYSHFDQTPSYIEAEKSARERRLGLWKDEHPVNPYIWRKQKHEAAPDRDYNSRKAK